MSAITHNPLLPVIHELVRERRFPHFFRSQYPGERGFPRESPVCLVSGFEKSAEIAVLGLIRTCRRG